MNVSWTLLLAGKCAMLFIISAVKIHISDIWNLFKWQNWVFHWPNGPSVKLKLEKKMNPKQFYMMSFHLQLLRMCFSMMLCCLQQIKHIGFKIFENRKQSGAHSVNYRTGHQKTNRIEDMRQQRKRYILKAWQWHFSEGNKQIKKKVIKGEKLCHQISRHELLKKIIRNGNR